MRSFLAVLLPDEVRQRLAAAAADLRQRCPRVAWVRVENLHLTLRFFGSVDEGTLGRARDALAAVAETTAPFTVTLAGFGGFPAGRAPRVVWVGVATGAEALAALHARLEGALAERRIPPEGRPFHGHVTLGRARDPRGAPELAGSLAAGSEQARSERFEEVPFGEVSFGEVVVEAVHLMRSDLDPGGARYSVLARGELRGGLSQRAAR